MDATYPRRQTGSASCALPPNSPPAAAGYGNPSLAARAAAAAAARARLVQTGAYIPRHARRRRRTLYSVAVRFASRRERDVHGVLAWAGALSNGPRPLQRACAMVERRPCPTVAGNNVAHPLLPPTCLLGSAAGKRVQPRRRAHAPVEVVKLFSQTRYGAASIGRPAARRLFCPLLCWHRAFLRLYQAVGIDYTGALTPSVPMRAGSSS